MIIIVGVIIIIIIIIKKIIIIIILPWNWRFSDVFSVCGLGVGPAWKNSPRIFSVFN